MQRALITGITGFTGQYLAAELSDIGFEVFGTTTNSKPSNPSCEFNVDLRDAESLKKVVNDVKPDVVAHLAAISFVGHDDSSQIYTTNIVATRHLLEALSTAHKKPHSVLLSSSATVYGTGAQSPLSETAPFNPMNDYGISKMAMEKLAALWLDKLPLFITRPFNYTGIGQADNFLIPKIMRHFREGLKDIELGNLDVYRDFSDVRDVAKIYQRLITLAPQGKIVNICSGQAISLQQIISMMSEIAGYEINVHINPQFVRDNEVKLLKGSPDYLDTLIGKYERIAFQDTLKWMYQGER